MTTQALHIVVFDIPFPANYGGAIDVFYRLKALSELGWSIHLHCFYKGTLCHHAQLESLCKKVHYYPRHTSWKQMLHLRPYAVVSRTSEDLLQNLLADDAPILFEGLVSCALIDHPALAHRTKYLRECNIEHHYYAALGKASVRWRDKLYYYADALRLKWFEKRVTSASAVFAIAHQDEEHFRKHYPTIPTVYVPASHPNTTVDIPAGTGTFILYHGNLDVAENYNAVRIIAQHIVPKLIDIQFVIAGRYNGHILDTLAADHPNVCFIPNPDDKRLAELIRDAQIHLLITEQATGLKLKLLNVLYNGRHVVVNDKMVAGTELTSLCRVATNLNDIIDLCRRYMTTPVCDAEQQQRKNVLSEYYDNARLATTLSDILMGTSK